MKVVCRFAPPPPSPREALSLSITAEGGGAVVRLVDPSTRTAATVACHAALPPTASQGRAYDAVAGHVVPRLAEGYACAILAYGQTATGKTHTIAGTDDDPGLLVRLLKDIFDMPNVCGVEIAAFEVYNEAIGDLLAKAVEGEGNVMTIRPTEKVKLRRALRRMVASSPTEAWGCIALALSARQTSKTERNGRSSRSHCIIDIELRGRNGSRGAKLIVADLAGSECLRHVPSVASVQAQSHFAVYGRPSEAALLQQRAQRHAETKSINVSLFALKKVIHALHGRAAHIPWRESILTSLLEDATADSSVIVACCSLAVSDAAETIATLRFAAEASQLKAPPPSQRRLPTAADEPVERVETKEAEGVENPCDDFVLGIKDVIGTIHPTSRALFESMSDVVPTTDTSVEVPSSTPVVQASATYVQCRDVARQELNAMHSEVKLLREKLRVAEGRIEEERLARVQAEKAAEAAIRERDALSVHMEAVESRRGALEREVSALRLELGVMQRLAALPAIDDIGEVSERSDLEDSRQCDFEVDIQDADSFLIAEDDSQALRVGGPSRMALSSAPVNVPSAAPLVSRCSPTVSLHSSRSSTPPPTYKLVDAHVSSPSELYTRHH